jgi:hypothetical protein
MTGHQELPLSRIHQAEAAVVGYVAEGRLKGFSKKDGARVWFNMVLKPR